VTQRTVIVGAGIAGVSAAAAMRRRGYEGEIALLGAEPELPYRRPPVSKEIVRGEKSADEIRIKKPEWYEQQSVDLRTGVTVGSIDTHAHVVRLGDGEEVGYDQLLLATGGRPLASVRSATWPTRRACSPSSLRGTVWSSSAPV